MSSRKSLRHMAFRNLRRTDRLSGCIRAMFRASRRMTARQAAPFALAVARTILVHRHVEHPVQASDASIGVFDRPVGAGDLPEALGVRLRAEQVVARVDALRAVGETPLRDHLADGRESAD